MRRCVWSRNLKNEEAMDRVGPQRHRRKNKLGMMYVIVEYLHYGQITLKYNFFFSSDLPFLKRIYITFEVKTL